MSDISTALWITALGMGLVFGAILLLWLMMVLLTALTAERTTGSDAPEPVAISLTPNPSPEGRGESIARAAAIATAIAMAEQETSSARALAEPPTAIVSAWQLGMRTRLLAQKGNRRRN